VEQGHVRIGIQFYVATCNLPLLSLPPLDLTHFSLALSQYRILVHTSCIWFRDLRHHEPQSECATFCVHARVQIRLHTVSLSLSLARARAISLCMCAFYVCFVCPGCLAHAYVRMCMCVGVCTYFNTYVDTCMQLRSYTRLPSSLPCTHRLEVGDVITEIEGEPVVHKSCEDVVRLLTGKEHSQVKLCCLRLQVS